MLYELGLISISAKDVAEKISKAHGAVLTERDEYCSYTVDRRKGPYPRTDMKAIMERLETGKVTLKDLNEEMVLLDCNYDLGCMLDTSGVNELLMLGEQIVAMELMIKDGFSPGELKRVLSGDPRERMMQRAGAAGANAASPAPGGE